MEEVTKFVHKDVSELWLQRVCKKCACTWSCLLSASLYEIIIGMFVYLFIYKDWNFMYRKLECVEPFTDFRLQILVVSDQNFRYHSRSLMLMSLWSWLPILYFALFLFIPVAVVKFDEGFVVLVWSERCVVCICGNISCKSCYSVEHKLTESNIVKKFSIVIRSFQNIISVRANQTFLTLPEHYFLTSFWDLSNTVL